MTGVESLASMGLDPDDTVVAIVTGSGFRELGAVAGGVQLKKSIIDPSTGLEEIRRLVHGQ